LRVENRGGVYARAGDALTKAGDLADFLKINHFAGSIAVDTDAGRVVTTVFLTSETVAEDIADFLATLWETKNKVSLSVIAHRCEAENNRRDGRKLGTCREVEQKASSREGASKKEKKRYTLGLR